MYFKNKRSVIAIDAPGFGKSDAADLNMFEIAKLVNNLLTNLGIKKFDLVGHSTVSYTHLTLPTSVPV